MSEDNLLDVDNALLRYGDIEKDIAYAAQAKITFGISYLDDALLGILPNDLMLVGALPGKGKSAIGIHIAAHNANFRKSVLFVALEAEQREVEKRLKYQIISGLFFKDPYRPQHVDMSYRTWRFGTHQEELSRYEDEARDIFVNRYAQLTTVYRKRGFGIQHLKQLLIEQARNHDLVIIDHLHYFDLSSGKSNNEQIAELVKEIRDLNLFYNIPIILVAHLRKDVGQLAPDLGDFMGSSEIGKIATLAVMLAPNPKRHDYKNHVYSTVMSVPKSRTGSVPLVGMVNFSSTFNTYLKGYDLGRVFRNGDKETIEEIKGDDLPKWARGANNVKATADEFDC
jgi:replicative DNA helicase